VTCFDNSVSVVPTMPNIFVFIPSVWVSCTWLFIWAGGSSTVAAGDGKGRTSPGKRVTKRVSSLWVRSARTVRCAVVRPKVFCIVPSSVS